MSDFDVDEYIKKKRKRSNLFGTVRDSKTGNYVSFPEVDTTKSKKSQNPKKINENKDCKTKEKIHNLNKKHRRELKNTEKNKSKLKELTKEYKEISEKINNTYQEMNKEKQDLALKVSELKDKIKDIERPYKTELDKYESVRKEVEEKILKHHPGYKIKKSTFFAHLDYYTYDKLIIKDEKTILEILNSEGILEESIKIFKKPVRKLLKTNRLGKNIVYFDKVKKVRIKPLIDYKKEESKLYKKLNDYRNTMAKKEGKKPHNIFNHKILNSIMLKRPFTKEELEKIIGIGGIRLKKYGDDIIKIIRKHHSRNIYDALDQENLEWHQSCPSCGHPLSKEEQKEKICQCPTCEYQLLEDYIPSR